MEKSVWHATAKKNVSESPRHGLKMIAKDFDQQAIATRVKRIYWSRAGREFRMNFIEELRMTLKSKPKKDQVVIRMMGESTFDSGKAEIKPELKPLILRNRPDFDKPNRR